MAGTKVAAAFNLQLEGVLLLLMLALGASILCGAQNTDEREGTAPICNVNFMPDYHTDEAAIRAIVDVVVYTSSRSSSGYHRKSIEQGEGRFVYAIGACNGAIDKAACDKCMLVAYDRLKGYCNRHHYAAGAQIHLVDCKLRWEIYDFDW